MLKSIARALTYMVHPLVMTLLGMFIIFHSGTSLSVLQPEVKRIVLIVVALFTAVFPALMVLLFTLTKIVGSLNLTSRSERLLPLALTVVFFLFTYFVLRSIPQLGKGHLMYIFAASLSLFVAMFFNNFMKVSMHMLALGTLSGLIFSLVVFYGARLQVLFAVSLLVSGIIGSAQLKLEDNSEKEVYIAYLIGIACTIGLMFFSWR